MQVIYHEDMLKQYVSAAVDVSPERPILIDKFLENAIECEADAISDGADVIVPSVMAHIELAGPLQNPVHYRHGGSHGHGKGEYRR